MAAISSIPPELLILIFELGVHSQGSANKTSRDRRGRLVLFPVCVSLVSRAWRRIALDTPSIWSVILIRGSDGLRPYERDLLVAVLDRSRNYPLNVTIDLFISSRLRIDLNELSELLRAFAPHVRHTRRLVVRGVNLVKSPDAPFTARLAKSAMEPMTMLVVPVLDELHIEEKDPEFLPVAPLPPFLLGGTPMLRKLTWRLPSASLVTGLRHLVLQWRWDHQKLHRILLGSPDLQFLILRGHITDPTAPNSSLRVTLSTLRVLCLDAYEGHIFDIGQFLSAPIIDTLSLKRPSPSFISQFGSPASADVAASYVTRTVRTLHICDVQDTGTVTPRFFQAFPELERVSVSSRLADDFVLPLITDDTSVDGDPAGGAEAAPLVNSAHAQAGYRSARTAGSQPGPRGRADTPPSVQAAL